MSDQPRYRPRERFWPYADVPEEPTDEEIAALDPELREELFGPTSRAFSITIAFPRFDREDYPQAVEIARGSAEYLEVGSGERFRHRARFLPRDVERLRDLWGIVGNLDQAEVLIDDRPVPYARELWLPLFWFLLLR
ncbi:MAG: hypothetical protein H6Q10_1973 [Acidobacteria bacterium]|nr:hypothetical protein [Acidobacteriota bacterium]